jgi:hypothetical protein
VQYRYIPASVFSHLCEILLTLVFKIPVQIERFKFISKSVFLSEHFARISTGLIRAKCFDCFESLQLVLIRKSFKGIVSRDWKGLQTGLAKTRVLKKKPSPVVFFWVLLGFISFFWVFSIFVQLNYFFSPIYGISNYFIAYNC